MALFIASVFLAVFLAVFGTLELVFGDDRRVSRRLRGMTDYEVAQVRDAQPLLEPFRTRVLVPAGRAIAAGVRALYPAQYRARLRSRLVQAGLADSLSAERFLAAQFVSMSGAVLLTAVLAVLGGIAWRTGVFFALVTGGAAFVLPDVWLRQKRADREREIIRSLPDLLDMLTISVEAGLGFDAALAKIVRTTDNALAQEFAAMLQEVQAGASRKQALRALAKRVDVMELSTFVAAIVQADMFGVSVAHVLRTQAKEMRLKRKQRAEEDAQRAPVKMVVPLVLCILPATMVVILGPTIVRIGELFGL